MPPTHDEISPLEARRAPHALRHSRQQVIAEIDVPGWYGWFLAAGWVAVGAAAAFGGPWVAGLAPLLSGALHAGLASHALSGRHRSGGLSVRGAIAGHSV